jgi:hypothetical protein
MMNLDRQLQALIQNAPDDGEMRHLVETIAPVLRGLAQNRQRAAYFVIVQSAARTEVQSEAPIGAKTDGPKAVGQTETQIETQSWVTVTLSHRTQSNVEKTVLYAFSTESDADRAGITRESQGLAIVNVPIVELLFQFWALNLGDELVFFERPGDVDRGTTVSRQQIDRALQAAMQPGPRPPAPPADIA